MRTVCGIDLGTQSCKLLVYDFEARTVAASSQAPLDLIARDDGTREQLASWYEVALRSCFSALDPKIRSTIAAIGVSGQQHGLVALDGEGRALHPVKLWCDTSTAVECEELTEAAGGEAVLLAQTGMPMLPGYTAPKLLWLKKRMPTAFAMLRHVLLPHDYVNYLLTGEFAAECGDASGTALFDVRSRSWSERICGLIDPALHSRLPRLLAPDEPVGRIGQAASEAYGISVGVLVSAGGGDNMMGAIGTGALRDGAFTMSLGTSGTLYGHSDVPLVDPAGRLAAFCSSTGGWLPLLCTMNCTVASERLRALLGLDLEAFGSLASEAPIGAEGIAVLPFFNGERVPNLPQGRAGILGATSSNFGRANLSRAAMESAVFAMLGGLEAFRELGYEGREIRLTGGGSRSSLWRGIVADATGLPVLVPRCGEAAAMGAALQALWCLMRDFGETVGIEELTEVHLGFEGTREPNPAATESYAIAYGEYEKYLAALSPLYR